ncbi:hypothetical protein K9M79_02455 [Candidatus Woesearchaeota archaeon]|nr:hypothetical protein [Candidatus Woesearchaeota archaeon]
MNRLSLLATFSILIASSVAFAEFTWTDSSVTEYTPIQKVHISELRSNINYVRGDIGMGGYTFTDDPLGDFTPISITHFTQPRLAINPIYASIGISAPSWGSAPASMGMINRLHLTEPRAKLDSVHNTILSYTCCGSYGYSGVPTDTGSVGSCPGVDDSACGIIDCSLRYTSTGTEGAYPADVEYCYNRLNRTTSRCDGINDCKDPNAAHCDSQPIDQIQYQCGECKYILDGDCTDNSLDSCSFWPYNTKSGTCARCDGSGEVFYPADDTDCGTIDCSGWYVNNGTAGSQSTQTCYSKADFTGINRCEGIRDCKDANTADCDSQSNVYEYDCGICQYIAPGDCTGTTRGTCSNYGITYSCSAEQDCDYLDEYYITGTQSATTTSYCTFDDYNDTTQKCDNNGACAALDCGTPVTTDVKTADTCKYITGCSGQTPGSIGNYDDTYSCGTQTCGPDYYAITGIQGSDSTSYCTLYDYSDKTKYCDGSGGCPDVVCDSPSSSTTLTAGLCKEISDCSESTSGTIINSDAGASCGGGNVCDGNGNCCTDQYEKRCVNEPGHYPKVYWYDSCGNQEELAEDCDFTPYCTDSYEYTTCSFDARVTYNHEVYPGCEDDGLYDHCTEFMTAKLKQIMCCDPDTDCAGCGWISCQNPFIGFLLSQCDIQTGPCTCSLW